MSDDTISGQAAIESVDMLFRPFTEYSPGMVDLAGVACNHILADVIVTLKALPSAERRGRWINGNEGIWNAVILPKCSICGETFYEMNVNINGEYPYNYCPNCGARMVEEA